MEIYHPSIEDIERLKIHENTIKVSGDGVFATFQGEGITAGEPAVFIRLQFCNLNCGKNSGWKCDTGYTWDSRREDFWKEPKDWNFDQAAENIKREWDKKFGYTADRRVVFTGGEPMLQQAKILKVTSLLPDWKVEIETNGTIAPMPEFNSFQINCSPKLDNSGNSAARRYKKDVLSVINHMPNSWFKFVVTTPTDFSEIDNIVTECRLSPSKILIMPEGISVEDVNSHLSLIRNDVDKRGWKITLRNQLIWFGNKRRT